MTPLPDFTQPLWFALATLAVFLVVVGRYLLIAGLFHGIFYVWYPHYWQQRKINSRGYKPDQFKKEVKWSMVTALLFALAGSIMLMLWQQGYTKVYTNVNAYPLWWLPASLIVALLAHETYYYWLHRWMHHPKIFRIVHKVHHDSNITSPWTAFSFHPLEGLLQAIFLPALLLIMPMHLHVLILQLTIMTFSSVINHLDIEVYPKGFHKNKIGRWLIGATHHSLHHKQFKYNYGLYFTFWDKWKHTESPLYEKLFEEKTATVIESSHPQQPAS
jgi:Delta7-sterol 5-desaturase